MRRMPPLAAVLAAATIAMTPATLPAQGIFEACGSDLDTFCSKVKPGNGRFAACLYAHEDQISDACDAAVGEMADLIDMMFETIRFVKQECGADIQEKCGEVDIGGGRIFRCLADQRDTLSESCGEVVDSVRLPDQG